MKTLMRTLTLSAAALAALVSIAPKADAQDWSRGQGREARPNSGGERGPRGETFRGGERSPRGETFRGDGGRREGYRGEAFRGDRNHREAFRGEGFRGREFGGHEWRGREFRGHGWGGHGWGGHEWGGRAFFRAPAFFGRGYASPFRVYAGSRFYSSCPGSGYVYVNDLGWAFPPFVGAVWVPAHYDYDGYYVEGCWE
jgi:hypothetical protein